MIGGRVPMTGGTRPQQPTPCPRTDDFPAAAAANDADASRAHLIEPQLRAAQAALIFNRAGASNLVAPLVGTLVCWMLWNRSDRGLLAGWLAASWCPCCGARGLHRRFVRDLPANTPRWGRRCEISLCANGIVYGLIGTLQALDLAQPSSAVKGQFLATMSHEMRAPLPGIQSITRLLRAAPPGQAMCTSAHQRAPARTCST